ncbi:hypothetical protein [Asticcacaulis sp. W401b]|uniref:hypothetical protein n=1 Tax=Asticcacaulis sp. W401b TaxID=3388666 RepID=UPI003970B9C5
MHPLPNIFQVNLQRFYERVIRPTMNGLQVHQVLETGDAASMEEFLARAAAQVDNYTANEAAKAYALIISGLFERQLRVWARQLLTDLPKTKSYVELAGICANHVGYDFVADDVRKNLDEARLVANLVRHGDGISSERLKEVAPDLWTSPGPDYIDLLSVPSPDSESIRIRREDLYRYLQASFAYWGHVNPVPHAVTRMVF